MTVFHWLRDDPGFVSKIQQARQEARAAAWLEIICVVPAALRIVRDACIHVESVCSSDGSGCEGWLARNSCKRGGFWLCRMRRRAGVRESVQHATVSKARRKLRRDGQRNARSTERDVAAAGDADEIGKKNSPVQE
jgi:hypothetical protein